MGLPPSLFAKRVVVCVGSGGVGKTTTTAAVGLRAAIEGRRVLCLTVDPAKRLAESLGLARISTTEQVVSAERLRAAGVTGTGSLTVMMLDARATFDEIIRKHASSPAAAERLLSSRMYAEVSTRLAGTHEYMAMEKLHAVRDDPRFDLVVLDTPPSEHALDFLDAPERLVEAVDSPATRWFAGASRGAGRAGLGVLGRGTSFVLRALSRFTGAAFLEDLAAFVADLNDLFGGFRARALSVRASLRGDDVAFLVVCTPEPLAVREAIELGARLTESGLPLSGVVVNRAHARHPAPAAGAPQVIAPSLGLEAGVDAQVVARKLLQSFVEERSIAERHAREVARLRARTGAGIPLVEVPALDEEVHELPALERVARHLFP